MRVDVSVTWCAMPSSRPSGARSVPSRFSPSAWSCSWWRSVGSSVSSPAVRRWRPSQPSSSRSASRPCRSWCSAWGCRRASQLSYPLPSGRVPCHRTRGWLFRSRPLAASYFPGASALRCPLRQVWSRAASAVVCLRVPAVGPGHQPGGAGGDLGGFYGRPQMVLARFVGSLGTAVVVGWIWARFAPTTWMKPPRRADLATQRRYRRSMISPHLITRPHQVGRGSKLALDKSGTSILSANQSVDRRREGSTTSTRPITIPTTARRRMPGSRSRFGTPRCFPDYRAAAPKELDAHALAVKKLREEEDKRAEATLKHNNELPRRDGETEPPCRGRGGSDDRCRSQDADLYRVPGIGHQQGVPGICRPHKGHSGSAKQSPRRSGCSAARNESAVPLLKQGARQSKVQEELEHLKVLPELTRKRRWRSGF